MEDEKSEIAQEAIFEIIENQMRDNTPPITKETYTRLKSIGNSHEDAMKLIGCAISVELFEIMSNKQVFNEERYSKNLRNLPDLPWEDE
jgi:hypothetical protein